MADEIKTKPVTLYDTKADYFATVEIDVAQNNPLFFLQFEERYFQYASPDRWEERTIAEPVGAKTALHKRKE